MKASDIRPGMVIILNGELYRVTSADHRSPGNKRAFVQTRMMRVRDGIQREDKLSSTEEIEKAVMESHEMQFLYKEGTHYHFMNVENYEQIGVDEPILGNTARYLLNNAVVNMTFCEGKPVGIVFPSAMEFKVVEAEPGIRTATAAASFKNAKIETGHTIKVPQFIEAGDRIRVNPNTDQYLERGKEK